MTWSQVKALAWERRVDLTITFVAISCLVLLAY